MTAYIFLNRTRIWLWLFWLGLLLGVTAQAQSNPGIDWRYTVRPGDTVSKLSRQYLKPSVSWQTLATYNGLSNANVLRPGAQLRMPVHWLAVEQVPAKLTAMSGDVRIHLADGSWHQARTGELLQTGQRIEVGRNSSARLQFADNSELVMQPQSSMALDTLSVYAGGYMADTQLRLQAGRVEVHANPQGRPGQKFDVITPAAVASVRGTQFVVEAEEARTIEQTTQGQVALQTRQGDVVVQEGYGSAARAGALPVPPEIIKPAPILVNPITDFSDFPITFSWAGQPDASAWVMQVGRDPHMAQLVLTQQSTSPFLDAGGLPDGRYYLRAWIRDAQDMPSKIAVHAFEVKIPRQLRGPVVQLPPSYFAAGPVALQLTPLAPGQRYWVQVTEDAEGRLPVWHQANASASLTLPVPDEPDRLHYLWIWVY